MGKYKMKRIKYKYLIYCVEINFLNKISKKIHLTARKDCYVKYNIQKLQAYADKIMLLVIIQICENYVSFDTRQEEYYNKNVTGKKNVKQYRFYTKIKL